MDRKEWETEGAHGRPRPRRIAPLTLAVGAVFVLAARAGGSAPLHAQAGERGSPTAAADTLEIGGGLGLADVVALALSRNPEVRDARLGLEEAEERVSEAWSGVFPSIDFSGSYTRNISPNVNFLPARIFDPEAPADEFVAIQFGADNQWNSTISLEQPLFDPAVFVGVGAAGRFRGLQGEVVRGRLQEVVTGVRLACYDLLLAQEQVRLTRNSIRRLEEALEENRALLRAGLVSDFDVLRLEVELANVEPDLRRAQNAVEAARRTLAVELGIEDPETVTVAGSLALLDLDDLAANTPENRQLLLFSGVEWGSVPEEEGLVAAARADRSDVLQSELTERLREAEVRLEQVEYLPTISLFGNYTINAAQNGDPDFFERRAYGRQVGVSVSLPIFTGLSRDARIDQKRALLRQAATRTELARDRGENEVRALYDQVLESEDRARAQARAVERAARAFEIASAQYREGVGTGLERTDAEVALRETEFNYAQAVYDHLVARARLDQAVGRVPMVDVSAPGEIDR